MYCGTIRPAKYVTTPPHPAPPRPAPLCLHLTHPVFYPVSPTTHGLNANVARGDTKTVTGVKHDGTRRLQDLLVDLLSKWLRRAKIAHMGGGGG